jgi:hypothetical protein
MIAAREKNLFLECPHKKFPIFKTDTVVTFPIKRYAKKFKKKGLPLTEPIFTQTGRVFRRGPSGRVYKDSPL